MSAMRADMSELKSDVRALKDDVRLLRKDTDFLTQELSMVKAEQQRHGDLIHQLIGNVGSFNKKLDILDQKVELNHSTVLSEIAGLRQDLEFTYHETAHNKLEMTRLKRYVEAQLEQV